MGGSRGPVGRCAGTGQGGRGTLAAPPTVWHGPEQHGGCGGGGPSGVAGRGLIDPPGNVGLPARHGGVPATPPPLTPATSGNLVQYGSGTTELT